MSGRLSSWHCSFHDCKCVGILLLWLCSWRLFWQHASYAEWAAGPCCRHIGSITLFLESTYYQESRSRFKLLLKILEVKQATGVNDIFVHQPLPAPFGGLHALLQPLVVDRLHQALECRSHRGRPSTRAYVTSYEQTACNVKNSCQRCGRHILKAIFGKYLLDIITAPSFY